MTNQAAEHPRNRMFRFWPLHIGGWSVVLFLQLLVTYIVRGPNVRMLLAAGLQIAAGFLLTSLLRLFYRRLQYRETALPFMVVLIVVCSAGVTFLWFIAYVAVDFFLLDRAVLRAVLQPARAAGILAYGFPDKLAWSALYFGIRIWRDASEERARANAALMQAQQAQLASLRFQLQPAFLFGALGSIRELIDANRAGARDLVTALAGYLRYSLVSHRTESVRLREELDAVRQFVAVAGVRTDGRFQLEESIAAEAEEIAVPPFIVQPLIERMVERAAAGAHLRSCVTAAPSGTGLDLSVTTTGVPEEASAEADERLAGDLAERLRATWSPEAAVGLHRDGTTVTVRLHLPMRREGTA